MAPGIALLKKKKQQGERKGWSMAKLFSTPNERLWAIWIEASPDNANHAPFRLLQQ